MHHQHGCLTVDDLLRMYDGDRRYELVNGQIDASPTPDVLHAKVKSRLSFHLGITAPGGYETLAAPGVNLTANRTHHRIPDLAGIRSDDAESPYLTRPPLLAVEVVSPESVFRDHHTKKREYAEFGIASYWIISPSLDKPGIVELRLADGQYREVTQVFGEDAFETEYPFPVTFVPHWLIASGPWKTHIGGE